MECFQEHLAVFWCRPFVNDERDSNVPAKLCACSISGGVNGFIFFAGETGLDPYTRAISDVYQDLYGEGSFTGKGIYEVDTMFRVLYGRFPRNSLLSHDLIEDMIDSLEVVVPGARAPPVKSLYVAGREIVREELFTLADLHRLDQLYPDEEHLERLASTNPVPEE